MYMYSYVCERWNDGSISRDMTVKCVIQVNHSITTFNFPWHHNHIPCRINIFRILWRINIFSSVYRYGHLLFSIFIDLYWYLDILWYTILELYIIIIMKCNTLYYVISKQSPAPELETALVILTMATFQPFFKYTF